MVTPDNMGHPAQPTHTNTQSPVPQSSSYWVY